MENDGAANTEQRALTPGNNQKKIKISSLFIDLTMYGPLPTKINNEVKDVAALNRSESSQTSSMMEEVADILLQLNDQPSKNPESAAETGPPGKSRYVSLQDLIGKEKTKEEPKDIEGDF